MVAKHGSAEWRRHIRKPYFWLFSLMAPKSLSKIHVLCATTEVRKKNSPKQVPNHLGMQSPFARYHALLIGPNTCVFDDHSAFASRTPICCVEIWLEKGHVFLAKGVKKCSVSVSSAIYCVFARLGTEQSLRAALWLMVFKAGGRCVFATMAAKTPFANGKETKSENYDFFDFAT